MVDQQLCLYAEEAVEKLLIVFRICPAERAACNIPHRIEPIFLKFTRVPSADPPEVCKWAMGPKSLPIAHLVQLSNAYAVCIGGDVLCHNVHRDLREIEICTDSCCRRDTRFPQHRTDETHGKVMCRDVFRLKITRHVDEDLVDGVDMDILGGDISQIDLVDPHAVFHIESHARRGDMVGNSEFRVRCQFGGIRCLSCEHPLRSAIFSPCVRLLYGTDDLE